MRTWLQPARRRRGEQPPSIDAGAIGGMPGATVLAIIEPPIYRLIEQAGERMTRQRGLASGSGLSDQGGSTLTGWAATAIPDGPYRRAIQRSSTEKQILARGERL